jgi:hypothetical protein
MDWIQLNFSDIDKFLPYTLSLMPNWLIRPEDELCFGCKRLTNRRDPGQRRGRARMSQSSSRTQSSTRLSTSRPAIFVFLTRASPTRSTTAAETGETNYAATYARPGFDQLQPQRQKVVKKATDHGETPCAEQHDLRVGRHDD